MPQVKAKPGCDLMMGTLQGLNPSQNMYILKSLQGTRTQ